MDKFRGKKSNGVQLKYSVSASHVLACVPFTRSSDSRQHQAVKGHSARCAKTGGRRPETVGVWPSSGSNATANAQPARAGQQAWAGAPSGEKPEQGASASGAEVKSGSFVKAAGEMVSCEELRQRGSLNWLRKSFYRQNSSNPFMDKTSRAPKIDLRLAPPSCHVTEDAAHAQLRVWRTLPMSGELANHIRRKSANNLRTSHFTCPVRTVENNDRKSAKSRVQSHYSGSQRKSGRPGGKPKESSVVTSFTLQQSRTYALQEQVRALLGGTAPSGDSSHHKETPPHGKDGQLADVSTSMATSYKALEKSREKSY